MSISSIDFEDDGSVFESGLGSDLGSDIDIEDLSESEQLAGEIENLALHKFKITSLAEIEELLTAMAGRASDMIGVNRGTSELLLDKWNWNIGEMTSSFIDNPGETARRLGLDNSADLSLISPAINDADRICGSGVKAGKGKKAAASKTCPICCDEVSFDQFYALKCGHAVCRNCFAAHISLNAIQDRKVFSTRCPGSTDCKLLVPREVVMQLCGATKTKEFDMIVAQHYVDKRPLQFRYCPQPNCEFIAEKPFLVTATNNTDNNSTADSATNSSDSAINSVHSLPVKCNCQHTFCFQCGLPSDHYAIPCNVAREWLSLVDHEQRSTLWISQNTKKCPQCHTQIQRSEGCNHMSCGNCKYQFCWVCSQSWGEHSGKSYYNCVKFKEDASDSNNKSNKGRPSSKKQKERLTFYMLRYDNHAHLAMNVEDRLAKQAHNLLAWAYVLLCCAVHTNQKLLLEELITELGRDVEDSSSRLKQRIEALTEFLMTSNWVMDQNVKLTY